MDKASHLYLKSCFDTQSDGVYSPPKLQIQTRRESASGAEETGNLRRLSLEAVTAINVCGSLNVIKNY